MEFLSLNNFGFLVTVLLPGFIVASIIDRINPKTKYYELIFIFKCLIYGLIINLPVSAFLQVLNCILQSLNMPINIAGIARLLLLIIVSIAFGLNYNKILNVVVKKLNIHIKSNIPTAWDYIFSKGEENYVVITLNDDTKIKGWWGADSFASDPEYGCDLFLEEVYYKKGKKEWVKDTESKGVYIAKDNIKFIEFKGGENERKDN